MAGSLFTYGTLEFEEVFRAVTGLACRGRPARLEGYVRYLVRDRAYPGIVAQSGAVTPGTLYSDLAPECVARIDRFEGPLYERREVEVRTPEGALLPAWTYIVPPSAHTLLSREPWDSDRFARHHLAAFLGRG